MSGLAGTVRRSAVLNACLLSGLVCGGLFCSPERLNGLSADARTIESVLATDAVTAENDTGETRPAVAGSAKSPDAVASADATEPSVALSYEKMSLPDIENAFRVGSRFISGGQPDSKESFVALKKLGVTTAISVDGSVPNVAEARAVGIQYVHIPIGYDTVSPEQALQLVVAVQRAKGKVFVHCHHGKHRGPAALASVLTATGVCSRSMAIDWMKQAGTAPEYAGLYAAVEHQTAFTPHAIANFQGDLPEVAEVPGTVSAMVSIDVLSDGFKAWEAAIVGRNDNAKPGAASTAAAADDVSKLAFDPKANATLLREQFQELVRHPESISRGEDYLELMRKAESAAADLSRDIPNEVDALKWSGNERDAIARRLKAVAASCKSCHEKFRNVAPDDERAAGNGAAGNDAGGTALSDKVAPRAEQSPSKSTP